MGNIREATLGHFVPCGEPCILSAIPGPLLSAALHVHARPDKRVVLLLPAKSKTEQ